MPNGHRDSYRIASGASPSPAHTSDSEETCLQQKRYRRMVRLLPSPWKRVRKYRRTNRLGKKLLELRLLPASLLAIEVSETIAQFL